MTFYRLENEEGKGPFVTDAEYLLPDMWEVLGRHNSLPNPEEEALSFTEKHFCGFPTKKSIYKWFTKKELSILLQNGYSLYKCQGKAERGQYQVTFLKKDIISKTKILCA